MKKKRETSALIKRAAVFITIVTGCAVLAGWIFNIPGFRSLFTGFGNMRFNTAICFILSGVTLYLLRDGISISKFRQTIAYVFACLILLTGFISLCYYIFGWDAGINELLWKVRPQDAVDNYPGKMSLIVSFNFTMLGIVFLLLGKRKYNLLIQVLLIAMIPGSLVVILNHVYGISFLTSIPLRASTSMLTAILFIVLFIGIFISPALEYVQFSFVKKIAVFFVLVILLRGTVFFALDRNNQLSSGEDKLMAHNHEVLLLAEKINAQCNDIQSATRGYIITAKADSAPVLSQAPDTVKNIIDHLRIITKENAVQQFNLDSLESYFKTFIASQNELVDVRRNKGFEAAQKIIINGRGIVLLNKVHSLVSSIEQEENQILDKYKTQNEVIVKNSSKIFTLFQVIAALLMVVAFKMIYDHVRLRNKIEEALKKSLKETSDYKYALNESSIVSITDEKGIIKHVNDNFCKISKRTREELIGQDHFIINSGHHTKEFMRDMWLTIENGRVWRGELKNKAKDGTYYWVDTIIVPFVNDVGKPYQYLALRSDITQRKELEAEILKMNQELQLRVEEKTKEVVEKEQQYRFLLQNMREGIQLISFDWKYLFVNSSAIEHSKYADNELTGNTMMEKYPGIEKTELFQILENCMKNRCPKILENEFIFPDGTKRWFELSIQPVPEGLFILSMDIGERKKVEQQLQESERFLNESQEVSKIGSYVLDFKKGIWKASQALDNIFGLMPNSKHTIEVWISILHPDDRVMIQEYFAQEVIGKKKRFDKEYKIINKKTKKECWVHGIGDLEFDSEGNIVKMLGTIQDITERKEIIKRLQFSNERYELVNKATLDTIWDWDHLTGKGQWGDGIIKTFGYKEEKLLYDENWVNEFVHPDDRLRVLKKIQYNIETVSENWQDEFRFQCADGTYKDVFDRGYILFDENKKPYRVIGAITDITERKKLEKELAEQKLKEQKLINEITIQAQEKERKELGRELHDNVNQILATVKMYLGMVNAGDCSAEDNLLEKSYQYVNEAMKEIRKLSHSLVAPSLGNLDLKEALQILADDTNLLNGLKVELIIDEKYNEKSIGKTKELMLYRVVQEQLTNITKYAKAKEAFITLKKDDNNLLLTIADNGVGFDTTEKSKGIGLTNMKSRIEFYSGNLNIISAPCQGCTLEISIPSAS